jgi:soluble lytic murein transglycosylase-like protein
VSKALLYLIVFAAPAMAGEYAVLTSGFRIHADRHEREGQVVRLYTREGVTELPAAAVSAFEQEDYTPPEPRSPEPAMPAPVRLAQPVRPDPKTLIRNAAVRSGLPPEFVESVATVESAMRPDAISPKGAIGVMQLMPSTARALDADPSDPAQNIDAGTRLLRDLLIKYDGDVVKALAAYNAGAGAVDRYQGLPPYPETQQYVNKVIRSYQQAGGR